MVNINGLHKSAYQKQLDGSEEQPGTITPQNERIMTDDQVSRCKSLAVGS